MKKIRTAIYSFLLVLSFIFSALTIPLSTGYDLGVHDASVFYSTQYLMQPTELDEIHYALQQVRNMFSQQQIIYFLPTSPPFPLYAESVYGHLENFEAQTTASLLTSQIVDCEVNHEFSTVFYYGHQNMRGVGLPWPERSYGFVEQAAPDADPETVGTIWDSDIYYAPTVDNHHFIFLWTCNSGNTAGSLDPLHGMPISWTRQNLSTDGYHDPDESSYCFISFQNHSATFIENLGVPNQIYKYWMVFFYYYALQLQYSINDALDYASYAVGYDGGWSDPDNRLSGDGYPYLWYGGGNLTEGGYWGKMRIYGNGDIHLPVTRGEWVT